MKNHFKLFLPLIIGIVLMAFAALSIAQTTGQQGELKKPAESCAIDGCCCHGDSCKMKTGEKPDAVEGCCCGDSCLMKHDRNHASDGNSCCGTSCQTTAQGDVKRDSAKPACCAHGQTATNMTAKHDMKSVKKHDAKHGVKNGCCCCGDSCEMKPKQSGY